MKQFNDTYEAKKQSLVNKLADLSSYEQRKPVLDEFFNELEEKSLKVKESQGYGNVKQQLQRANSNVASP